jgi:hypothetical protein
MASAEIRENVLRLINDRNRREDEQEFDRWCEYLASLPAGLEFMPKGNFEADIELQPLRWMSLGIDLIQSSKVTARLELAGGDKGPPISSYLPYPVFQMGAEIFLKGMWLCRHLDCRQLTDSSYVDPATRKKYRDELGGLSHDLLKIISETRKIPEYHDDASTMRSLDLVERIIRRFYFPPYKADKRTRWADSRYPKRVYGDAARQASASNLESYPQAEWVERLFRQMEADVDRIWKLRASLAKRGRVRPA